MSVKVMARIKAHARVLVVAAALCSAACHHGADTSRHAASETSVKPGINDGYKDPDVDQWISRFERPEREIYAQRELIVADVGVAAGSAVADVGAGTGFLTLLLAEATGPRGKVVAVDIVPEFLDLIETRAREAKLQNVKTHLCSETSVELPPGSIDLVLTCDTYHHFEYPASTLASIHRALKPGGLFVVVDFERIEGKSREWVLGHVRTGSAGAISEITQAGFELLSEQPEADYLAENYMLKFKKAE